MLEFGGRRVGKRFLFSWGGGGWILHRRSRCGTLDHATVGRAIQLAKDLWVITTSNMQRMWCTMEHGPCCNGVSPSIRTFAHQCSSIEML